MVGDIGDALFATAVAMVCIGLMTNAAMLAGALLAALRSDHRNPVPRRGLDWYQHHWERAHPVKHD